MPVWLWACSVYYFVCRREISQPVCWAQKMWLRSKAESCVAVLKSTEPKLMSPLETQDLMVWPHCLCLTQHLCWVGGAKPANKSILHPLKSLCCFFPREMNSQSMQVFPITLLAFPSSGLIENHWQIWQLGRSHPWALCLSSLLEVTAPGHSTCAWAHTSCSWWHSSHSAHPGSCFGALTRTFLLASLHGSGPGLSWTTSKTPAARPTCTHLERTAAKLCTTKGWTSCVLELHPNWLLWTALRIQTGPSDTHTLKSVPGSKGKCYPCPQTTATSRLPFPYDIVQK